MQKPQVMSRDDPFIPIVRALCDQPLDSPAFLAAAEAAGPVEAAYAAQVVAQRKRRVLQRQVEIEREKYKLQRGY